MNIFNKKGTPWNNQYSFKFGFLMQFCSSAAFDILYTLIKQQTLPISIINFHFKKDISNKKIFYRI